MAIPLGQGCPMYQCDCEDWQRAAPISSFKTGGNKTCRTPRESCVCPNVGVRKFVCLTEEEAKAARAGTTKNNAYVPGDACNTMAKKITDYGQRCSGTVAVVCPNGDMYPPEVQCPPSGICPDDAAIRAQLCGADAG
jgi:hypothetical protein